MNHIVSKTLLTIVVVGGLWTPGFALAGDWSALDLIWPLCNRLGESPGSWVDGNDCPQAVLNDPELYTDAPIHHGHGFRNFNNTSSPISFHRGIDLRTFDGPVGNTFTQIGGERSNPVFSAADGFVYKTEGSGTNQKITVRHPLNGFTGAPTCTHPGGNTNICLPSPAICTTSNPCLTTVYNHVQALKVTRGDVLHRGQHIAWSGVGDGGMPHLHFEIREPQLRYENEHYSGRYSYGKDAVNPLRHLPYIIPLDVDGKPIQTVEIQIVEAAFDDYTGGTKPLASVIVNSISDDFMFDFEEVEFKAYSRWPWETRWMPYNQSTQEVTQSPLVTEAGWYHHHAGYNIADGTLESANHNPEKLCRDYSPFPESSSLWNDEMYHSYFADWLLPTPDHHGLDGLVELNASGDFPGDTGRRVHDFDYELITAEPNDSAVYGPIDNSLDADHLWWDITVGFRGYDIPRPPNPDTRVFEQSMCYVATVRLLPKDGVPERVYTAYLSNTDDFVCNAKAIALSNASTK